MICSRIGAIAATATLALGLVMIAAPALADDQPGRAAIDAIAAVESIAPSATDGAIQHSDSTDGSAISVTTDGVAIAVARAPGEGITLARGVQSIGIGLPTTADASPGQTISGGVVAFDNHDDSVVVPVVKQNGSVQITSVSTTADAPSFYSYPLTLPDGGSATINPDGSVSLVAADGTPIGSIAAPWATDAAGRSVPTHYELDGLTLVQVVALATPGIVFPVVADPSFTIYWWGYSLKYSQAQTKALAGQSPQDAAVLLCGMVPTRAGQLACAVGINAVISLGWGVIKQAARDGRCAQLNVPYPPVPELIYEVSC